MKKNVIITLLAIVLLAGATTGTINFQSGVGRAGFNDLKVTHIYSLTGTNPYYRLINTDTGFVWDDVNSVMTATPTWTDSDISLTDKLSTIDGWLQTIPTGLPNGIYDCIYYDASVADGSRSNADAIHMGKQILVENEQIFIMQVK